ncbi:MAG: hypothetical protein RSD85_02060 [Erysipelotrichaceae bacterium]
MVLTDEEIVFFSGQIDSEPIQGIDPSVIDKMNYEEVVKSLRIKHLLDGNTYTREGNYYLEVITGYKQCNTYLALDQMFMAINDTYVYILHKVDFDYNVLYVRKEVIVDEIMNCLKFTKYSSFETILNNKIWHVSRDAAINLIKTKFQFEFNLGKFVDGHIVYSIIVVNYRGSKFMYNDLNETFRQIQPKEFRREVESVFEIVDNSKLN